MTTARKRSVRVNGEFSDIARARTRSSPWSVRPSILVIASLLAGVSHAQAPTPTLNGASAKSPVADDLNDDPQDEIVVKGSRQRGSVATDIPAEVTLGATAIRALGAADLKEVFDDLSPEIKQGDSLPGATAQTPIVLVNGQRIAGFSSVKDLPPESVSRIEIFPEKVALQYGYAPDQRVVNIVLRSRYRALTLLGRYTIAPNDWRGIYRAKIDLIHIGENSHWNIDLDYHHEDPILAGTTLTGPGLTTADGPVPVHTLARQDDGLTISGAANRNFGNGLNAELTAHLDLDAMQSRPGLSEEDGELLEAEGLGSLIGGPLNRNDRTVDAQTDLTLNGKLDTWRWSFIGKLDEQSRVTITDPASGSAGLQTILIPSPGMLGQRCDDVATDLVSTTQRTASGDLYLNGNLFALPAGAVTAALRTGFAFTGIRSDSPIAPQTTDRDRSEGNAQANLDFPMTSKDSAIGKMSVGLNGEVRQLSDFGTLATYGSSLDWSPVEPVSILATYSHEQQAPTLLQLGEAGLATPDLREYDFVQGNTAIIDRIEGGNADLERQTSQIGKVRLQVSPLRATNLALSAEYTIDRTRDPIASLTAATSAAMAAFPDHFARDAGGYLTAFDVSPVNLARRDRQQVRWGINYSAAFGEARPAANGTGTVRNQFQIALYDTWRLQDDVVLRDGQPRLNLLGGDIIADTGGTPDHEIELQTTISTTAWSADINAEWQTHTTTAAGTLSPDRLTFSQGIRLNLRLQLNLANQHWLTRRLPWLRGNLNISADNLLGAHTRVHDSGGGEPAAYTQSYLNPTGRTFRITLRKRFR
jgi:iron complex outermembrane receptor protein